MTPVATAIESAAPHGVGLGLGLGLGGAVREVEHGIREALPSDVWAMVADYLMIQVSQRVRGSVVCAL